MAEAVPGPEPEVVKEEEVNRADRYKDKKFEIKATDMIRSMKEQAKTLIEAAVLKHKEENDMAKEIQEKMDELYGFHWHCFFGKFYGSCLRHDMGFYLYGDIANVGIILYRTL